MIHLQEVSSSPSCNLKRNISNGANTSNEIKYLPKQDLDNIRIECNKSDERDISNICNKSVKVILMIYYICVANYSNYYIIKLH